MQNRDELPIHARILAGETMFATRTHIVRRKGDGEERHPLTGVRAEIHGMGSVVSHKGLGRTVGGAAVGSLVGAPLLGALAAPAKREDNRRTQVVITGPAFCWTFSVNPDAPPFKTVGELNNRAAAYTANPDGVEKRAAAIVEQQVRAARAKAEYNAKQWAAEQERKQQKVANRAAYKASKRALAAEADQKLIDKALAKAAAARDAGNSRKAAHHEAMARQLRVGAEKRAAKRAARSG